MSALKLAKGLVGDDGKIIIIDTEAGSGNLYAHLYDYDIITIKDNYAPKNYVEAITAAEDSGYDVIIIDSLTHAWNSIGGLLEQVSKKGGNSYTAWKDVTPQHNSLVDSMLTSPVHIIATIRSKVAYEMEEYTDQRGMKKVKPVKIGLAPIQREGMDYEFTVMMDINQEHNASASKDRTDLFKNEVFQIDEKTGKRLLTWLEEGVDDYVALLRALLKEKGCTNDMEAVSYIKEHAGKVYDTFKEVQNADAKEIYEALHSKVEGKTEKKA